VRLGLLIIEVSISHSIILLWTSDRPVAGTSTWQHTALTRDRYPRHGAIEAAIPASEWPQNHALDRAAIGIGWKLRIVKENAEVLLIATKETGLEQAYLTSGSRTNCTRRSFTRMLLAKTFEIKRRLLNLGDTPARVVKDIFIIVPFIISLYLLHMV